MRVRRLVLVLTVLCLVPAVVGVRASGAGEVVLVVVNPAAPVRHLSPPELRAAYLGETAFWGGTHVRPALLRVPPRMFASFLKAVTGITPDSYERYWMLRIFRDGGIAPRPFDDPEALVAYVARTPGAVGFLRAGDLAAGAPVHVAARLELPAAGASRH